MLYSPKLSIFFYFTSNQRLLFFYLFYRNTFMSEDNTVRRSTTKFKVQHLVDASQLQGQGHEAKIMVPYVESLVNDK